MKTLIANIKYAIRNKEIITVGGGVFTPDEMQQIVNLYEAAINSVAIIKDSYGKGQIISGDDQACNLLNSAIIGNE